MRKTIFIIALSFQCAIAFTQQNIFKTYTVSDGLVNNAVRRVFQDSKGFLWIATWEGLSKYDGHRFTNFTERNGLSHNLVNDIGQTNDGNLYVAMNNGSVDIISNDSVQQKKVVENIVVNRMRSVQQNNLIAFTDNAGIVQIEGKKLKHLNSDHETAVYDMVSLEDSLFAAATHPISLVIFDRHFRIRKSSTPLRRNGVSNCIYKDKQNRLWLGTSEGLKLFSYDGHKDQITFEELPASFRNFDLFEQNINCILQQDNGTFWIGTGQGLISILPDGRTFRITEQDGLPSRDISCIYSDRENNLWIGTALGLSKIAASAPVAISENPDGADQVAYLIKKISPSEALISSGQLLYKYNFRTGKRTAPFPIDAAYSLIYVRNTFPPVFFHHGQLKKYDLSNGQLKSIGNISNSEEASAATTTDYRHIFIGTFRGIFFWVNGKSWKDSTFHSRVNNILQDRNGYVWIGTWSDGLFRARFDTTSNRWVEVRHVPLKQEFIRSLFEDAQGNIWAGTRYGGVFKISEKNEKTFKFAQYDQQNGLSSNWVRDIAEDEKGNIWIVTMSGIDKLVKEGMAFNVFNYSRVLNFITNANLITHLEGNRLLCSSVQGVFQITDKELERNPPQPVLLTHIALGNVHQSEARSPTSDKIALPYSENHALFEFTSPTYLNEKEIMYSYRLKGSGDTTWSRPSNSHSVQYASLAPGHYKFEVRMMGWNGAFGPVTAFLFTIKPPYWNTWWFYLLLVVVALIAMYSLYRYRINHLLRLQKVRNTIATDLHDDIGSTLTNISLLSELSNKNLEQPSIARKYLQRITEESVATQQALDDIIWSVNTRNDNMQELQARMRRYAGELFESTNINCEFDFDPSAETNKLNMEQRRDVYLVFKECLNNVHKHASAKNIYIKIAASNGILKIHIEDDGKGFNPTMITHRNGIKNLETRVEKWNGQLNIHSAEGKGTRIEITIPVKSTLLK